MSVFSSLKKIIGTVSPLLGGALGGAVVGYFSLRVVDKRAATEAETKAKQERRQLVAKLTGLQHHVADLNMTYCHALIMFHARSREHHNAGTSETREVAREAMEVAREAMADWRKASIDSEGPLVRGLRELLEAISMAPILFPDASPKLRSLVSVLCRQETVAPDTPDENMQIGRLGKWIKTEQNSVRSTIVPSSRGPCRKS